MGFYRGQSAEAAHASASRVLPELGVLGSATPIQQPYPPLPRILPALSLNLPSSTAFFLTFSQFGRVRAWFCFVASPFPSFTVTLVLLEWKSSYG